MKGLISGMRFRGWVFLVSFGIAIILCLIIAGILVASQKKQSAALMPTAVYTLIPAPSQTVTVNPVLSSSPTPETKLTIDGISQGIYVQIQGTGGEGLRLRKDAGVDQDPLFLGMESEVFLVKDGPKQVDGYVWWYLVAPYDENRKGWAASKYLAVVAAPAP
jgi:hypothetical protein